jgi:hypothetical protein
MTICINNNLQKQFVAPALPVPPLEYDQRYATDLIRVLRLYFNQIDNFQNAVTGILNGTACEGDMTPLPISIGGTNVDAFGRLRVSEPYTLFDSQSRYAADNQFDTSTSGTGSTTFNTNQSSVSMAVTGGGVGSVVRQTYRVFPYQPGKSLLVLATFVMDNGTSANLNQKVGYFNTDNGVFFQRTAGVNSFVVRTNTTGTPSDARSVNQSAWNGDKLDGTGASGLTLDLTKPQILWMDFEWLGVGSVRCGFIINGEYIVCHTFETSNVYGTTVYMTTAILPVRYEITTTTAAVAATLTQVCSSVMSEGGFEQVSIEHIASMTNLTASSYLNTSYKPLISIRLASGRTGAVVIPIGIDFLPSTADNFQIALVKNATLSTTPSWSAVASDANVEFDIGSTSYTGGTIVFSEFATGKTGRSILSPSTGYNWDLQLGASIAGVSDTLTLVARTVTTGGAATGGGIGAISFYDLTQ